MNQTEAKITSNNLDFMFKLVLSVTIPVILATIVHILIIVKKSWIPILKGASFAIYLGFIMFSLFYFSPSDSTNGSNLKSTAILFTFYFIFNFLNFILFSWRIVYRKHTEKYNEGEIFSVALERIGLLTLLIANVFHNVILGMSIYFSVKDSSPISDLFYVGRWLIIAENLKTVIPMGISFNLKKS